MAYLPVPGTCTGRSPPHCPIVPSRLLPSQRSASRPSHFLAPLPSNTRWYLLCSEACFPVANTLSSGTYVWVRKQSMGPNLYEELKINHYFLNQYSSRYMEWIRTLKMNDSKIILKSDTHPYLPANELNFFFIFYIFLPNFFFPPNIIDFSQLFIDFSKSFSIINLFPPFYSV